MWVTPLIECKRDGGALRPDQWRELIADYAAERVPDYQMAALLMASVFTGLTTEELGALTGAMLDSGTRLDFSASPKPCVDKHSTGGVGDKVSLVLAPLMASLGADIPMISGRGLGHTGGTLDKLEAIPGFRTDLSPAEVGRQMERVGCVLMGQTEAIAPVDRRLYALRDATATVESVPLIAASIMSKKLAEGISGLVLDVKRGDGAFLPGLEQSLELARTMIAIGQEHGCRTAALLTAMDRPLGRACGNALETEEAIAALRCEGPPDLMEVTYALAVELLLVAGLARDARSAQTQVEEAVTSGRAAEKFGEVVAAQGGNPGVVEDPGLLPQAAEVAVFAAARAGCVSEVKARVIGRAIVEMGGGRRHRDDAIDPSVGFVITAKPGDTVTRGEPLASVYASDAAGVELGLGALAEAIRIGDPAAVASLPLISHRVTRDGVKTLA